MNNRSEEKADVFESINLKSEILKANADNTTDVTSALDIPESESETSDDEYGKKEEEEEEEMDPAEFLSPELPGGTLHKFPLGMDAESGYMESGGKEPSTPHLQSPKAKPYITDKNKNTEAFSKATSPLANYAYSILNSDLLYPPASHVTLEPSIGSLAQSKIEPHTFDFTDTASIIESLTEEKNDTHRKLIMVIKRQLLLLEDSDARLNKFRIIIHDTLVKLSDKYNSLHEVYMKDLNQTERINQYFLRWDKKRTSILHKISNIKSNKNEHGSKLEQLLDKSNDIDNEIQELEEKLRLLRNKKKVIKDEIQYTSSVLESKSSKYVHAFKNLELEGREKLIQFLNFSGIPNNQLERIVTYRPVDVTFGRKYKEYQNSRSVNSSVSDTIIPRQKNRNVQSTPQRSISLAGVLAEQTRSSNKSPVTAFEMGFENGQNFSNNIKKHLVEMLSKLNVNNDEPVNRINHNPSTDDNSNTIKQKLDTAILFDHIDRRTQILHAQILESSKKAMYYIEASKIWNEMIHVLQNHEEKLYEQLHDTTSNVNDDKVISILQDNLQHLRILLEKFNKVNIEFRQSLDLIKDVHPCLQIMLNEIKAVYSALSIVSRNDLYLHEGKSFEQSILRQYEHSSNAAPMTKIHDNALLYSRQVTSPGFTDYNAEAQYSRRNSNTNSLNLLTSSFRSEASNTTTKVQAQIPLPSSKLNLGWAKYLNSKPTKAE